MTTREREVIASLLNEGTPSPATRRWLATPAGARALASHRRVLRALDAWGAAVASPRRTKGRRPEGEAVVYYGKLRTPVGPVLAAVGDRGVVAVSFRCSERAFTEALRRRHGTRVIRADGRLGAVTRQMARYFRGPRRTFGLPVDLRLVSPFQRRVLEAARRVPAGRVVSYAEIARRIGQPGASRAVGQALGRNPIPIIVPCHRVVASRGGLGGYTGGTAIKRRLLTLEGAPLAATG